MKRAPSALQAIYDQYAKHYGHAQAKRWLKQYQQGKAQPTQEENKQHISQHLEKALDRKRAQRVAAPTGQTAIDKAHVILADARDELGGSFPLALSLVAAALEDGHTPEDDQSCNTYHCMTTYDGLGYMAARAVGRDKPYTAKTVQRWLHPNAPHAHALRQWVGSRAWYTDTLRDYSNGAPVVVIGGHVLRVYLRPGVVVSPTRRAMSHQWRNLEADRHAGRTASQRQKVNVHIEGTTKDAMHGNAFAFETNSSTNRPSETTLLEEHYLYPDISTPTGAHALRTDVLATAQNLTRALYGTTSTENDTLRTLRAVWIAVKHDIVNGNSHGRNLIKQAYQLATELNSVEHTLKDPAGYVWALIERRGLAELRRDCPPRIFSRSMWAQMDKIDDLKAQDEARLIKGGKVTRLYCDGSIANV